MCFLGVIFFGIDINTLKRQGWDGLKGDAKRLLKDIHTAEVREQDDTIKRGRFMSSISTFNDFLHYDLKISRK